MTRTEERLTDALTAAVSGLHEDTLRPLAAPARRDRRWTRWLAPAAAAAAVTLVVSLAAVLTGRSPALPGPAAGTSGVPRYYADMDFHGMAVVRATATGAVTASIPVPRLADAPDGNITAAANGMFFVAAFASQSQERIYRFEVTSTGQVSGFTPVPGGGALSSQVLDQRSAGTGVHRPMVQAIRGEQPVLRESRQRRATRREGAGAEPGGRRPPAGSCASSTSGSLVPPSPGTSARMPRPGNGCSTASMSTAAATGREASRGSGSTAGSAVAGCTGCSRPAGTWQAKPGDGAPGDRLGRGDWRRGIRL
jgi:hypothetical protein